ncbi:MAG TPA: alkaline phosphatase family protein [Longimicrobiales bacterium]|nr:alkaline phosphatase family protein [Longimicrobiales bacterium]
MNRAKLFVVTLLLLGAPVLHAQQARPDLVVFISVDQLRGDYLDRFESGLSGGLLRLKRDGAYFVNAFQDHAVTVTAVGHATMLSGRFPRSTGIISNNLGVPDPQARSIEGTASASPFRFRGSTLIDWMRVTDPLSRALSVSVKDRGAILPLGRAKQQAFWYSSGGSFTTSNYYADTLPDWVKGFNALKLPEKYAGRVWRPLRNPSAYPEPDSGKALAAGQRSVFPHALPTDAKQAVRQLSAFPWIDEINLQFALAGLDALKLGKNGHIDLLAVSLSATDAIGHEYGPDSRELHDQILRLDLALGAFLDSVYKRFPPEKVVVALTADHGVTSFPESVAADSARAAALRVDLKPVADKIRVHLKEHGYPANALVLEGGLVMFSPALMQNLALRDSVAHMIATEVRKVRGVERVDFVRELPRGDTINDAVTRRWLHALPPDVPVPLVITLKDMHIFGATRSATHGSPRDRDAHVPIIFFGPQFKAGRYPQFARTVDIAPTLARVISVLPTEPLDGRALTSALKEQW